MPREYFKGTADISGHNLEWESVFPKTTGFDCVRCGFCCYGRIGLTEEDLRSFDRNNMDDSVNYGSSPPPWTPFEKMMKLKQDGSCVHLNNESLCSIYKLRPMVCRCFPFMLSPGYENDLHIDAVLRCPFVDISKDARGGIQKPLLDQVAKEYSAILAPLLRNTTEYNTTLVRHIRATMPAAFFPKKRKLGFMDSAIDKFALENPADLTETAKNWAEGVSRAVHTIIFCDIVEYEQMPPDSEILAEVSFQPGKKGFEKRSWSRIISDLQNKINYPPEAGGMGLSFVRKGLFSVEFTLKTSGTRSIKRVPFSALSRLEYSEGALDMLRDYMRLLVRRSGFQYCVARSAEFLVDYARLGVVDFELEVTVLANAVAASLDPLSRTIAALRGRDAITSEDVRYAIANIDGALLTNLTNEMIANQITSRIMRQLPKRPKAKF